MRDSGRCPLNTPGYIYETRLRFRTHRPTVQKVFTRALDQSFCVTRSRKIDFPIAFEFG